jgi:hypothetical protein
MAELGIAVLFTYTAEGKSFTDAYSEADYADPQLQAERMRSAVGDDFPGAIFSIGMNERARDIMTNRRMADMGFENYDHAAANGRS